MNEPVLDVVVIGAGHAGLCISKLLSGQGLTHRVFERGTIGESWRSQRWDSFKLNSTNRHNLLPGQTPVFQDPEAFATASAFVSHLRAYAEEFRLPVTEYAVVTSVEKDEAHSCFSVAVTVNGLSEVFYSQQVVVASGSQNQITIPHFARNLAPGIVQKHASEYRHAGQLPEGAVLVVGSAQSGTQIAEDLTNAGRQVYLCTCKVGRMPRTYRGRDIFDWLFEMGLYDTLREEASPELLRLRPPQVSGVGVRGKTCSLQSLARMGAIILGKADGADSDTVYLQPNAAEHVLFADRFSSALKATIDGYILRQAITAPAPTPDPNELPDETAACASPLATLSLKDYGITSVIWATGFSGDFRYLKLPVFNDDNSLKHHNGISEVKGLYFLGLPWLRKRKSGIIFGVADDASYILDRIQQFGAAFRPIVSGPATPAEAPN
ncbi:flavin-containing monooxygenase [Telluribacter humicola]|uniref:flavin-containing monooxygenase n=1 Tax=Telluribacter humicola TaxID=1720261 RepID=UPI001A9749B8|nr:NAD(P)/FAD-dependent oxidoreductase [Telluribacter humicola]